MERTIFFSSVFIQLGKQWLWFGLERSLFHSGSNFIPTQNTIRMGWGENQAEARASEMANKRGNKLGMKYSGWSEQKVEREGNREITKARNTQEREWRGSKWLLSTPPHLLKFSFHDEMWENSLYKSELEVTKTNPNWQVTAYISLSLSIWLAYTCLGLWMRFTFKHRASSICACIHSKSIKNSKNIRSVSMIVVLNAARFRSNCVQRL